MSVKKFKKGIPFYTVNNENIRDMTFKNPTYGCRDIELQVEIVIFGETGFCINIVKLWKTQVYELISQYSWSMKTCSFNTKLALFPTLFRNSGKARKYSSRCSIFKDVILSATHHTNPIYTSSVTYNLHF